MRRRTVLAALPTLATAGCLGLLSDEPIERSASPATVGDDTLASSDYELKDSRTDTIRREVTVAGQTREVVAENAVSEYARTIDLGPLGEGEFAVFAVVATPAFEIAGRTMSPVAEWSNRKLATELQGQYSELEVGEEVDVRTVETLGTELELSTFEGTARVGGAGGIDVYVHVGKLRHDSDFVIVTAIHPQRLEGEGERVRTLVGNLTH